MEVFKKSISTVFGTERRYVIPLFQRPYVWTRTAQWEPLWEDIAECARLELENASSESAPHFLGAIVIQQRMTFGDQLLTHDVIDGQQRLTTFQLLLTAFHDVAVAREEAQVAASLRSWTRNGMLMADPDVEQFKLWPTNRDVEQYRLVVEAGSRAALEAKHPPVIKRKKLQSRPRMVEAHLFFSEQISAWIDEDPPHASDRMKALRRVFDRRMQLVSIELGRDEDPQAIFETLNARGVPLLASDLLRNYVFQRAATPGEANRLYEKYWKRFEEPDDLAEPEGECFWEKEERQGRLNRARLDLFVQHYLTMKRGVEVGSGRLFPEYKQWVERELRVSLEEELMEFSRYATIFQALLRPDPRTTEGKFARRLRILDNSTVYPFVLSVAGDTRIAPAERQQIYADLESFLVRRLVCGRTTKNYNRLFLQLLRDFARGEHTSAAFRALLLAGTGEAVDWPDDETFERAWREVDAYQELKPAKVEMLLRALSDAMTSDKAEHIVLDRKLTVEHVLPQTWEAHWPLDPEADPEAAAAAREELVHDFGNLTLLTQPLNSSVSNGPASAKLKDIALQSVLPINTHFQGRGTWTESDIHQRAIHMAALARGVWARPA